jgi:hypothetical protein
MITVSKVTTAIAVFLILATNGLMIVIANVDKTLKSPVFVIIQSLSATSIIRNSFISPDIWDKSLSINTAKGACLHRY